ncbi:MAG: hypothetical protein WA151_10770 [Desulfatirhabdiaceae bacterium]
MVIETVKNNAGPIDVKQAAIKNDKLSETIPASCSYTDHRSRMVGGNAADAFSLQHPVATLVYLRYGKQIKHHDRLHDIEGIDFPP